MDQLFPFHMSSCTPRSYELVGFPECKNVFESSVLNFWPKFRKIGWGLPTKFIAMDECWAHHRDRETKKVMELKQLTHPKRVKDLEVHWKGDASCHLR